MASIRITPFRRAVPAALVAGMLLTLLPAATFAETPADDVLATESAVLDEVNRFRESQGLGPLRMAEEVSEVARERSRSMKRLDYFAHVSPDGSDAGSLLKGRRVAFRVWGEVIGWTVSMGLGEGSGWMVDWWKNSPAHRDLLLSRSFKHAGVGIAQDGPKVLWTIVFVNQADRTAPVARVGRRHKAVSYAPTASGRTLVRWWGHDRPLAVNKAEPESFSVQHRRPGGAWHTVIERTTARQAAWSLEPGTHWFRVRARDRGGDVSVWREATRVEVPAPRAS